MILHGLANDVRHFMIPSVGHLAQGMSEATLHGFQPVLNRGNGAFENHVGGVIQEIIFVHIAQRNHVVAVVVNPCVAVLGLIGVSFRHFFLEKLSKKAEFQISNFKFQNVMS